MWLEYSMREHICIRRPEWVAGTSDRPEVGVFTQTNASRKPSPWRQIAAGETVWMKWTGGPVVAKGVVAGYREFAACSPNELRNGVYGTKLHDLEAYWKALPERLNGLAIFLEQETWVDPPMDVAGRSFGSSWVVLPDRDAVSEWMTVPPEPKEAVSRDPRGPRTAGKKLRFQVFKRDSYTCQYCGRRAPEFPLHVDHVIPWAHGGHTVLNNLRTACSACNLGKGASSA